MLATSEIYDLRHRQQGPGRSIDQHALCSSLGRLESCAILYDALLHMSASDS